MRWYHARRRGGEKALRVRFSPGRPPKLRSKQLQRLIQLLLKGPMARGYRTNLWTWTTARIALLIDEEFGVDYHPNHIGRLMHRLKWSHQKPERRAIECDDQAVEQWKRQQWPGIKKAARLGAPLVFADESGFLLIPNVAKTWAPIGQTPIHRHVYRRDKISVISGITVSPKRQRLNLYYYLFYDNIGQEEVCLFLGHLLRHLRGQGVVVLDNSRTHKGELFEELLRQHPRLHLENFPSYAPDLNPDEGVWSLAKRKLANSCPKDIDELMEDIIRSINGIRRSRRSCGAASSSPSCLLFWANPLHYLYVSQ